MARVRVHMHLWRQLNDRVGMRSTAFHVSESEQRIGEIKVRSHLCPIASGGVSPFQRLFVECKSGVCLSLPKCEFALDRANLRQNLYVSDRLSACPRDFCPGRELLPEAYFHH